MRNKISSRKRWSTEDVTLLQYGLENKWLLSELKPKLIERSDHAIIRQAYLKGYSARKLKNGDVHFVNEINRREPKDIVSTEAISLQTTATVDYDDVTKHPTAIVPKKSTIREGRQLIIKALDLLEQNALEITPNSVLDASKFLMRFQKEVRI